MVTPTHWNDLVYRLWIFMNYEVVCDLTWGWYWWKFWHCFPSPPSLPWAACVLSRSPGSQPLAAQEKQMPPGQWSPQASHCIRKFWRTCMLFLHGRLASWRSWTRWTSLFNTLTGRAKNQGNLNISCPASILPSHFSTRRSLGKG